MTLRLGLLSTARINEQILDGARESERVEVVAVASRDAARAQGYAREHGLARAHASYEALLADPDVDAVYVSLPNALHAEWSIRALEAGKHVLCEKPFARRPEDVERAFAAAERAGRVLSEAFMYRHHPQTARIAGLVREGAVGRLLAVRTRFGFDLLEARGEEDVRLDPALEGGALMDVGCYCVSALRLLCGEPERVAGEAVDRGGVDMTFAGQLRFPGGVVGQLLASFAVPVVQELEVVGAAGTLRASAPFRVDWGGTLELRRGDEVEQVAVPEADAYRLELDDLAAAVAGERAPLLGRDDALGQARTIAALYESARTGRALAP